jgi:hypothetical protein
MAKTIYTGTTPLFHRVQVDVPTGIYSERFLFRKLFVPKIYVPKVNCSESLFVRKCICPIGLYSERFLIRRVVSPNLPNRSLILKVFVPKGRLSEKGYKKGFYSERPFLRKTIAPKVRFSEN